MSFNCVKKVENDYDKYVLVSTTGKINLPDYLDKKSKDLAKAVIEKNEFTAKASGAKLLQRSENVCVRDIAPPII